VDRLPTLRRLVDDWSERFPLHARYKFA
jgi:hypothetical protein